LKCRWKKKRCNEFHSDYLCARPKYDTTVNFVNDDDNDDGDDGTKEGKLANCDKKTF
jgi:hypothetical protein